MTKEKLAQLLSGSEHGNEIIAIEEEEAKKNNLVVVFAHSDDCMEFRGAIDGEVSCFRGGVAYLDGNELIENEIIEECQECRFLKKYAETFKMVKAVWCPKDIDCTWKIETDIPHAKFNVYEGEELFCIGIVFDLSEI